MCRLKVTGLDASLRGSLDVRALNKAAAHCLHFDLRLTWDDAGLAVPGSTEFGSLHDELTRFSKTQPLDGLDRERLLAKARTVLEA